MPQNISYYPPTMYWTKIGKGEVEKKLDIQRAYDSHIAKNVNIDVNMQINVEISNCTSNYENIYYL